MTELEPFLQRLGLQQYYGVFVAEGFDTWDTVLDIQESDLESLGVRLGHRRKLQRAIADYRGISVDRPLPGVTPKESTAPETPRSDHSGSHPGGGDCSAAPAPEQKRRYRRHPKADDNAPEKPPSAYVLFSNRVREEVKAENLTFTEIAKLVGERWQKLEVSEKEHLESHVAALKEKYNVQLVEYKKTDQFRKYNQYLADFKAKYDNPSDGKRTKLESHAFGGHEEEIFDHGRHNTEQQYPRRSSASSITMGAPPHTASHTAGNLSLVGSPYDTNVHRAIWDQRAQLVNQRSLSDDSSSTKVESESLSRTAQLSTATPLTGSPSPATTGSRLPRGDYNLFQHHQTWPPWQSGQAHSPSASSHSGTSATQSVLSTTEAASNQWRERGVNSIEARSFYTTSGREHLPHPIPQIPGSDTGHGNAYRTLPPPLRQTGNMPGVAPLYNFSPALSSPKTARPPSADGLSLRQGTARQDIESANVLSLLAEQRPSFHHRRTPQDYSKRT